MESIVTLPINIMAINTILLSLLKSPVIPKLNPTVLYAEKHSKAMSNSIVIFFSVNDNCAQKYQTKSGNQIDFTA